MSEDRYHLDISPNLRKELEKLKKKNRVQLIAINKKAEEIRIDPHRYKNFNYPLQNLIRVHIGTHFVLLFSVDEATKTVILEKLEHHNDAY
jgi:YafQ family addiction module toxin component